jgi:hypothetical protein
MLVHFAMVCDVCGVRQPEYDGYLSCRECDRHVCKSCAAVYDPDPPGHAVCRECQAADAIAKLRRWLEEHRPLNINGIRAWVALDALEAAQKDAERLDWLEKYSSAARLRINGNRNLCSWCYTNIRESIDAAMAKEDK